MSTFNSAAILPATIILLTVLCVALEVALSITSDRTIRALPADEKLFAVRRRWKRSSTIAYLTILVLAAISWQWAIGTSESRWRRSLSDQAVLLIPDSFIQLLTTLCTAVAIAAIVSAIVMRILFRQEYWIIRQLSRASPWILLGRTIWQGRLVLNIPSLGLFALLALAGLMFWNTRIAVIDLDSVSVYWPFGLLQSSHRLISVSEIYASQYYRLRQSQDLKPGTIYLVKFDDGKRWEPWDYNPDDVRTAIRLISKKSGKPIEEVREITDDLRNR